MQGVHACGHHDLAGIQPSGDQEGLLRFPDTLTRLHGLTKADNLGLGFVVVGLLPHARGLRVALTLLAIWLLVMLSGAVISQLIADVVRRERPQV
jgi:multicomponent Na+:H+ antiporter subunit G